MTTAFMLFVSSSLIQGLVSDHMLCAQERRASKRLEVKMEELQSEMEAIDEEQSRLRQEQREMKQHFEKIEAECAQLRQETSLLFQQNLGSQLRLLASKRGSI
ncbi:hypothetical protein SLA2020_070200 [Shorea laevis]